MAARLGKKAIGGVIPPTITAFTPTGEVYEKGIRDTVDFLLPNVDGLFICGTYGSGLIMTVGQRKRAAEIFIQHVAGRVPVIVQVGIADTESAVELAKHAEVAGADAVASIAPYYYNYTQSELKAYYKALIDAVDIPVYAYNNPKTSGNPLSAGLIKELASYGLSGLKDSSFDMVQFYKFASAIEDPDFRLIVGTEAIMYPALMAGAAGCVSGVANVYPEKVKALYSAVVDGRYEEATSLQYLILAIRDTIKLGPTIAICHDILKMRGVDAGVVRSPFLPTEEDVRSKVRAALEAMGLL
ncbi:MAG: dihydrodipicolinate synthase family protein [Firmicutes bacterium]|jgi:N-acetylneuraminate lyase/4-hydroxy-tetrahydrodipicolinate synthase|nr:dihydrodipicolinate synthase family protein [Bacillota bacterium]